jgi:hypothetical protein
MRSRNNKITRAVILSAAGYLLVVLAGICSTAAQASVSSSEALIGIWG